MAKQRKTIQWEAKDKSLHATELEADRHDTIVALTDKLADQFNFDEDEFPGPEAIAKFLVEGGYAKTL